MWSLKVSPESVNIPKYLYVSIFWSDLPFLQDKIKEFDLELRFCLTPNGIKYIIVWLSSNLLAEWGLHILWLFNVSDVFPIKAVIFIFLLFFKKIFNQ